RISFFSCGEIVMIFPVGERTMRKTAHAIYLIFQYHLRIFMSNEDKRGIWRFHWRIIALLLILLHTIHIFRVDINRTATRWQWQWLCMVAFWFGSVFNLH